MPLANKVKGHELIDEVPRPRRFEKAAMREVAPSFFASACHLLDAICSSRHAPIGLVRRQALPCMVAPGLSDWRLPCCACNALDLGCVLLLNEGPVDCLRLSGISPVCSSGDLACSILFENFFPLGGLDQQSDSCVVSRSVVGSICQGRTDNTVHAPTLFAQAV